MPLVTTHPRLAQMLEQRCFFLFLALLALLVAIPFLGETAHGRVIIVLVNISMLVTAVAAVGRSRLSLAIAIALAVPPLAFQLLALQAGDSGHKALSWGCNAILYTFPPCPLLHFVLRQDQRT